MNSCRIYSDAEPSDNNYPLDPARAMTGFSRAALPIGRSIQSSCPVRAPDADFWGQPPDHGLHRKTSKKKRHKKLLPTIAGKSSFSIEEEEPWVTIAISLCRFGNSDADDCIY